MKMYKFIILALVALLYSCGQNAGLPNSSGGTTAGDPPAVLGSIEFTSATPNVIGIDGSGKPTTSIIIFTVKDNEGDAISDATVTFTLEGPAGTTMTESSVVTSTSGTASTILNSGSVAGRVSVTASVTVGTDTASTTTTPISVGGGVPSARWLSISRIPVNLEGLAFHNIQSTVLVLLADRFGNYNVMEGTSVSFYAESGAIDTSGTVDATGAVSVTYRTQNPVPVDVAPLGAGSCADTSSGSSWIYFGADWESCLLEYVAVAKGSGGYGISTTNNPRDGWARIMAATTGEEAFNDLNGNGLFDTGEFDSTTQDTSQEAFIDVNDDGDRDTSPFELYIDDDGDESYDPANTIWDSSKTIFIGINTLITGSPAHIEFNQPDGFSVADSGSLAFKVLVSDMNLNHLISGSTITISKTSAGTIVGTQSYTFPDIFTWGPKEISFTLEDTAPGTVTNETVVITATVTWKGADYVTSVTGEVN